MNYRDYIKVNKLVEIEVNVNRNDLDQKEVFASRIEDMGKDYIVVAAPYRKGSIVPVAVGEEVQIRIGKDGTYFLFHTKVTRRITGHQPMLQLSIPSKVTKIQMRNWVRVEVTLPIYYRKAGYEMDFFQASTIDLSGGGVCMLANHPIDKDTLMEVEVVMADDFTLKTKGKITRCYEENNFYKIGICFQELSERNQDYIVGFVFKKQREHIQKGVGKSRI